MTTILYIGDNGYFNNVANTDLQLQSIFNRALGTWFHLCMTWSNTDKTVRVYLDGREVGSAVTERAELEAGTSMCLGNQAHTMKRSLNTFGGELFKLNIYNRVLAETEIKNMASDLCSCQEEMLASIKVLSWGQVLSYHVNGKSGEVSKISTRCKDEKLTATRNGTLYLEEKTRNLQEQLTEAHRRWQNSEQELAETRNKIILLEEKTGNLEARLRNLEAGIISNVTRKTAYILQEQLTPALGRLQNAEEELARTRNKTIFLEEKTENLQEQLSETHRR